MVLDHKMKNIHVFYKIIWCFHCINRPNISHATWRKTHLAKCQYTIKWIDQTYIYLLYNIPARAVSPILAKHSDSCVNSPLTPESTVIWIQIFHLQYCRPWSGIGFVQWGIARWMDVLLTRQTSSTRVNTCNTMVGTHTCSTHAKLT